MSSELTNNDFRLIFNTHEKENKELLKEEKKLKRKQKYLTKSKKKEEKNDKKYRDRADERRKGIIKNVKDATVLYDNVNNTIDESKFMGGDIEHTHLVKGLDFLLLDKVRNKLIDKISSEKEKLKVHNKVHISNNVPTFLHNESKYIFKYFFLYEHSHHIHFKQKIESIYDNIMNNMKFKSFNKNIHSVNYKYNIGMEIDQNDIPIKYIYSVDDIKNKYSYYIKKNLLSEIDTCFKWHVENKKKKKSERLPKRPLADFLKEEKTYDKYIDIFANNDEAFNKNRKKVENSSTRTSNRYDSNNVDEMNKIRVYTKNEELIKSNEEELNNKEATKKNINDAEKNINLFGSENICKTDNQVFSEKKTVINKNVFSETYEECYPGYRNSSF